MKKTLTALLLTLSLFIPKVHAESWRKLNVTCGAENTVFNDVAIASNSTVYVSGWTPAGGASVSGIICKSIDRGDSWISLTLPAAAASSYVYAIDCSNESNCFAVTSACQILKTTTGGEGAGAWSLTTRLDSRAFIVGPDPCNAFNDVQIVPGTDGNTVMAVGNLGTIARTINGGVSWSVMDAPWIPPAFQTPLQSIDFAGGSNGWIAGNDQTALKSIDGGVNWSTVSVPAMNGGLNNVFGLGSHVWLNGNIDISRSDNSGDSWGPIEVISSTATAEDGAEMGNLSFKDSYFVSSTTGWTVGDRIMQSNDGGTSWVENVEDTTVLDAEGNVVTSVPRQKAIDFHFANLGFIVGWDRLVLRRYTPGFAIVRDGDYTITIYPNLVPDSGWSHACSNQNESIYHIIAGVRNNGQAGVAASQLPFSVRLETLGEDGNPIAGAVGTYSINSFPAGWTMVMIDVTRPNDLAEGAPPLSPDELYQRFNPNGVSSPRIRMTVDVDNIVREAEDPSDAWENDNVFEGTIACGSAAARAEDSPQPSPPPRGASEKDKGKKKKGEKKKKSKWGK